MQQHVRRFVIIAASAMAAFADFAVGMFVAAATAKLFGFEPTLWHLCIGGLLALSPDFDVVIPIIVRAKEAQRDVTHHTSIFHRPLVMVPAATLVALAFGGAYWGAVALICLVCHFLHDTWPLADENINWLWPFAGKDPPPYPLTHWQWMSLNWWRPSLRAGNELAIGFVCLASALLLSNNEALVIPTIFLLGTGAIAVWMLAHIFNIRA